MKSNIDYLTRAYIDLDEPIPYKLSDGNTIIIKPISLKKSEFFLTSVDILEIDKNASPSVEIIQMSYLRFLNEMIIKDEVAKQKLINILVLCLDLKRPWIEIEGKTKAKLWDAESGICITSKDFDEISRIIKYQNILHYDDEYIDPELKQAMSEVDAVKNIGYEEIGLGRRIAIITAHCGLSKKEQLEMTLKSHSQLFEECCGEVEYSAVKPIALFGGEGNKVQWIFRKKKNKFDGYFVNESDFAASGGTDVASIKVVSDNASNLEAQFNMFNKK